MGESHFAKGPVMIYGLILIMNALSFNILYTTLIRHAGRESGLAQAFGKNWKGWLSVFIYGVAIRLAFINPWIAFGLYWIVAATWFIPDPRLERTISQAPRDFPASGRHDSNPG